MGIADGANPGGRTCSKTVKRRHSRMFSISTGDQSNGSLRNQVLVPVLGDYFGLVLERGELVLAYEDGAFRVDYYETPLPIAPTDLSDDPVRTALDECETAFEPDASAGARVPQHHQRVRTVAENDERSRAGRRTTS